MGIYGGDGDGARLLCGIFLVGFGDECEGYGCPWPGVLDACCECLGCVTTWICTIPSHILREVTC